MRVRTSSVDRNMIIEIILRLFLAFTFLYLEKAPPFIRKIHPDEAWLYKNPRTNSYVPMTTLLSIALLVPTSVIFLFYFFQRRRTDLTQALLALSLALSLNGALTNIIKIIVGRPRPDFFWRCFPDGISNLDFNCTGDASYVNDGRKSFPSGHSSWSFASLGFLSFYIAGRLHTFSIAGRGQGWRILAFVVPLSAAMLIALSRTCDYHHHWQDVLCGSLLGISIAYMCYRHYYPSLNSLQAHRPYCDILSTSMSYEKTSSELI